ncbi:MAG: hypothetical protein IT560_05595 [Alphaproteobacteria bacterium]|nr:hypothetical protein [Alphaproteobacteria bacterium]
MASKKTASTLARNISNDFHAVAIYEFDEKKSQRAELSKVLAGMTREKLDGFFMQEIGAQMEPQNPPDPRLKGVLDMLAGKDPSQFRITNIEVADGGKTAYLPVIDDQLRNKALIVTPGATAAASSDAFTYVSATDPGAKDAINTFLADGARLRAEQGTLRVGEVQNLIENLIVTVSATAEIVDNDIVSAGTTLGDILPPIARGEKEVSVSSVAAKKPPPKTQKFNV